MPAPFYYVLLAHEVHRAYQLHALEMLAVELWHHRLHLRAVEHTHEYRFDNVVKVMPEGYLIAAETAGVLVQPAAAHTGAHIARVLIEGINSLEYRRIEDMYGYAEPCGVINYTLTVALVVAGIHYYKLGVERYL